MGEENYSKLSVAGKLVDEASDSKEPGHFSFYTKTLKGGGEHIGGMVVVCPGCKWPIAIPFRSKLWPKQPHDWEWNGNREKPTLNPSLHHVGCWHGHLRKGVFTSC